VTQTNALFGWFATLLLLIVAAGNSFATISLTKQAGGQVFGISGYQVFPVSNALILMQAAALLVGFLIPAVINRVISGFLSLVMTWHFVLVVASFEDSLAKALAFEVTAITGVSGLEGQLALIESINETGMALIYPAAVLLNTLFLVARAIFKFQAGENKPNSNKVDDSVDLWDAQR
jgi:hypothetical protein